MNIITGQQTAQLVHVKNSLLPWACVDILVKTEYDLLLFCDRSVNCHDYVNGDACRSHEYHVTSLHCTTARGEPGPCGGAHSKHP